MGRPRKVLLGTAAAQPKVHGSASRDSGDGRLDPVRWRRPGRGMLLRLVAVAALLATAAVVSWFPPRPCTAQPSVVALPPPASRPAGTQSGQSDSGQFSSGQSSSGQSSSGQSGSGQSGSGQSGLGQSTAVPPGSVGVPIRLADPTALALIRPGNRVDLLRRDDAHADTTAVAADALVLDVNGGGDPNAGGLLLALTPAEAERAVANSGDGFAIVIRPG